MEKQERALVGCCRNNNNDNKKHKTYLNVAEKSRFNGQVNHSLQKESSIVHDVGLEMLDGIACITALANAVLGDKVLGFQHAVLNDVVLFPRAMRNIVTVAATIRNVDEGRLGGGVHEGLDPTTTTTTHLNASHFLDGSKPTGSQHLALRQLRQIKGRILCRTIFQGGTGMHLAFVFAFQVFEASLSNSNILNLDGLFLGSGLFLGGGMSKGGGRRRHD